MALNTIKSKTIYVAMSCKENFKSAFDDLKPLD